MKPPSPSRRLAKHVVAMLQLKALPAPVQARPTHAPKPSAIQRAPVPAVHVRAKTIPSPAVTPSKGHIIQRFPVNVTGTQKTIHILPYAEAQQSSLPTVDVRSLPEPIPSSSLGALDTFAHQIHNLLSTQDQIVVNCNLGQHRSHVVVIYYLFRYRGMTLTDAYNLVERGLRNNSASLIVDSLNNLIFGGPPPRRGTQHDWNVLYAQRGTSTQTLTTTTTNNNNNNDSTPINNNNATTTGNASAWRPYMRIGEREEEEVVREGTNFIKFGHY